MFFVNFGIFCAFFCVFCWIFWCLCGLFVDVCGHVVASFVDLDELLWFVLWACGVPSPRHAMPAKAISGLSQETLQALPGQESFVTTGPLLWKATARLIDCSIDGSVH